MIATVALGGSASNLKVAAVGHGLMQMTWSPKPCGDEVAFESIKAGVDAAGGAKVLLNTGDFYANDLGVANLEMLARFYDKYPAYVDKTVLSVKGACHPGTPSPDSSEENLRNAMKNIKNALRGTHRVDLFEPARVDKNFPIETIMQRLIALREEGWFDHIALSEISSETLRKALAVPGANVANVEIEVSAWSYEEETKKVIAICAEKNVAVSAYSPIGRGFLTGTIKSPDDIKEGDFRKGLSRFQPGAFEHNLKLVEAMQTFAKAKGVSPAQLAIAWVRSKGHHMIPIAGSSHASRTVENIKSAEVQLSPQEVKQVDDLIDKANIQGGRYFEGYPDVWG